MVQIKLLPHAFKIWGWVLFGLGLSIGLVGTIKGDIEFGWELRVPAVFHSSFFSNELEWFVWVENELTDELLVFSLILGGLFIGFSAERDEDELTALIRLKALSWAVVMNSVILLLATALIYDMNYLNVVFYNMFTTIILFVLRYQYLMFRFRKSATE